MKPGEDMKLADLMYGHEGRFKCNLSGRFDPEKYSHAPPIQICEMKCGCWVVADGNNRIGLILRKKPEATLADIPTNLLAIAQFGEWDDKLMDWWNPCAKSFEVVMRKRDNHMPRPRDAIYGVIEMNEDGRFFASTMSVKTCHLSLPLDGQLKKPRDAWSKNSKIGLSVKVLLLFLLQ